MRAVKFLIEENLLLSFAAVFLAAATTVQLGLKPQVNPALSVLFFGTFLFYNINRIRSNWSLRHERNPNVSINRKNIFDLLVGISIVGIAVSVFYLKMEVLGLLLSLACISMLYSFPTVTGKSNGISLRTIPYLKIFLITGIWSAATVVLPILQSEVIPEKSEVLLVFLERFIFLFVIALLFDIRDMGPDKVAGLKTLPLLLGKGMAMQMANGLLLVFLIVILLHYKNSLHFVLVSFIVSALSTFVFINSRKIRARPYFHYGILDGSLVIQPLLVLLFYYLEKWI